MISINYNTNEATSNNEYDIVGIATAIASVAVALVL